MANTIVLKKSSVASKVPLTGDLSYGELALNYADGKLYYKNSDTTIKQLSAGTLGGLSGVVLTSPANGEVLKYNGTNWVNGTVTASTATNITGGSTSQILYQTAANTTGFITAPSVASTYLQWNGSSYAWATPSVATSVSATLTAGSDAQGQGALTTDYNVVTTNGPSNPGAVTLPAITIGKTITVVNNSTYLLNVYPASGAQIDNFSTNSTISPSIPVGGSVTFTAISSTQWKSSLTPYITGTALSRFRIGTGYTFSVSDPSTYSFGTGNSSTEDLTFGSDTSNVYLQSWGSKELVLNSLGNGIGFGGVPTISYHFFVSNTSITGLRVESASNTTKFDVYFGSSNTTYIGDAGAANSFGFNTASNFASIWTNSAEQVRINNSGAWSFDGGTGYGTNGQVLTSSGSGGKPTWTTVGGVGGGTTLYKGTATIDFGVFPGSNEASIAVTGQTAILSTAKIKVYVVGDDTTTDHTASDHRYLPVFASFSSGAIVAGTGFTIYARSLEKLQGTFKVTWEWSN